MLLHSVKSNLQTIETGFLNIYKDCVVNFSDFLSGKGFHNKKTVIWESAFYQMRILLALFSLMHEAPGCFQHAKQ